MIPQFLDDRIRSMSDELAIASGGRSSTYRDLLDATVGASSALTSAGVQNGDVVSIEGDYGVETIAAFLAAMDRNCIVVPLSSDSSAHLDDFLGLAEVEWRMMAGDVQRARQGAHHSLFEELRRRDVPGLVLFSSGSTGKHKAAVHDLSVLLEKFSVPRHRRRTLVFLQMDHIGGVNTLLYTLANGGAIVVPGNRSPAAVAAAIEAYRVELLPTSPTFLNLLLLSGEAGRHDLSSLELITYGTEPMPPSTLKRVAACFPRARLLQTYGLTELGILRSQSRGSDSLWVRVGGEGYETKVVDGRLWIRAHSAMLGYLNAPNPFDQEGFFDTGDRVEVDGDWLRILGRDADIINVGGSKVYPAEIEDLLLQLENVADVSVYGEPQPITGQVVAATVRLEQPEGREDFKRRLRQFCVARLPGYKIPLRVTLTNDPVHSSRYKRMRPRATVKQEGNVS